MAIKFQYNKTSLQQLEKQLKVRVRTLPIIKNKESALRMEVKRCKTEAAELEERLEKQIQAYEAMFALWNEFDASLIKVSDVHLGIKKIAGVRVPLLENVDFDIRPYSLFNSPKWYSDGIHLLKGLAQTAIEREFMLAKLNLLEHARKKTTQYPPSSVRASRVRPQTAKGPYFKDGSTKAGAPASKPPAYPTHRMTKVNAKL